MACIDPTAPLRPGGTDKYTLDNALAFERLTLLNFDELLRGKRVFDYGSGFGHQAIAMARQCGATVDGIDVVPEYVSAARDLAAGSGEDRVRFFRYDEYPFGEGSGSYDVIASFGCFEHYDDPVAELERMKLLAKPGGRILVTFAEPWYSHNGGHSYEWCKLPWAHLLFAEQAFMRVHNRYYPHCEKLTVSPGLNKMSVTRFERIMHSSNCEVEYLGLRATRNLPLVTHIPVLRELLTSACTAILRVDGIG